MSRLAQRSPTTAFISDVTAGTSGRSNRAVLVLEILLILLVARLLHLERQQALFPLLAISGAAWLAMSSLPRHWRGRLFLAVSIAALPVAFGWPRMELLGATDAARVGLTQAAFVLGIGLALFGFCHLLPAVYFRWVLLIAAGGGLAAWRASDASLFWPVLGSMFMFRLWVYLRTERSYPTARLSDRLSYFFMLPNAFFPFFPIVNYRDWVSGGADKDEGGRLSQRGVAWITRGMIHLFLYRVINAFLVPAPQDVYSAESVAIFMAANYGLYLHISGDFHIITGILLLLGFDLPRTHDRYFLASGLSDIWRRINIYWKTFLSEQIFLPAYFALRRLPRGGAVMMAVILTFVATWVFHSWQAFWLLGRFPLRANVAALWLIAGVLVAFSSLGDYRRTKQGRHTSATMTLGAALRRVAAILATFTTVSFFWACWTDPTFPQRLGNIARAGGFALEHSVPVIVMLLAILIGGACLQWFLSGPKRPGWLPLISIERSPGLCIVCLLALAIPGLRQLDAIWGREMSLVLAVLRQENPTIRGASAQANGYYEQLTLAPSQVAALMGRTGRPAPPSRHNYFDATRRTNAGLETELIPNWKGTIKGLPFQVNRWGMRDEDVRLPKEAGVYRVAVLGSSITMGLGVRAEDDFESQLERRFNASATTRRFEFLNFSAGSYYALNSLVNLRTRVLEFQPDALVYVAHQAEFHHAAEHLAMMYYVNAPMPADGLDSIIRDAGLNPDDSLGVLQIRLRPYARRIVYAAYNQIVAICGAHDIKPIFVYLPLPHVPRSPAHAQVIIDQARRAGFEVISLGGWLDEEGAAQVSLASGDWHLNIAGHRAVADRLWEPLRRLVP